MKKEFVLPKLIIIDFADNDVIYTSGEFGDSINPGDDPDQQD